MFENTLFSVEFDRVAERVAGGSSDQASPDAVKADFFFCSVLCIVSPVMTDKVRMVPSYVFQDLLHRQMEAESIWKRNFWRKYLIFWTTVRFFPSKSMWTTRLSPSQMNMEFR